MADPATQATEHYLARLDAAARADGLEASARAELRARTAEWIADRRAEAVGAGDDAITVVLDTINALGTPDELLTEARANGLGAHARASARLTVAERIVVIGLALGWMTAGISWIVGVIAMLRVARWTRAERVSAALVTLLLPAVAVQVGTATTDPTPLTVGGFVALIALTWAAPALLVWRVRRRSGLPV